MASGRKKSKQKKSVEVRRAGVATPPTPPTQPTKVAKSAPPITTPMHLLGIALLIIALIASFMLVLQSMAGVHLPGCGPESACGKVTSGAWGRLPGTNLPTSHFGFAYFLALLVAWIMARPGVPVALRWIVRIGAVGSIFLTGIMLFKTGELCLYCLAVHLANFAFLIVVEVAGKGQSERALPLGAFAGVMVLAVAGLWIAQLAVASSAEQKRERDLQDTLSDITGGKNGAGGSDPSSPYADQPFTGRWRKGGGADGASPIRIVVFSDFQCPDCKRVEPQLAQVAARDDVSVSFKHFPMSSLCNPYMESNPHPNACWAARAAEAAGMLAGNDAFWIAHDWLFNRGGLFENAQDLLPLADAINVDVAQLTATMMGDPTLERVRADIEEAKALGIHFTPMVFINGVEVKGRGVFANNAIVRAVDQLALTNPEPMTALADKPELAAEKYIEDWRTWPSQSVPTDPDSWAMGPVAANAAATIVVWGDYTEPYTAELDQRVRTLLADRSDPKQAGLRYEFRHYPFDQTCNTSVGRTAYPRGCVASRAAEAAGQLGGEDIYWRMHAWLMSNQSFSDQQLRQQAEAIGLDVAAFTRKMDSPEVADAIRADIASGQVTQLRGIPHIYINDRYVPRWRLEGEKIIERIIEEAMAE